MPSVASIVILMGMHIPLKDLIAYIRQHDEHWTDGTAIAKPLDVVPSELTPAETDAFIAATQRWCDANLMSVYVTGGECYVGWCPAVDERMTTTNETVKVCGAVVTHEAFYGNMGLLIAERLQCIHLRIPLTDESLLGMVQKARLSQLRSGDLESAHEYHDVFTFVDVNMDYWHKPFSVR
jgi:hypothetical protein